MIKDFQPINFKFCSVTTDCDCGSLNCNQLAKYTDNFSFQMENTGVFLSDELLVDAAGVWIGNFENEGTVPPATFTNWQNSGDGLVDWLLNDTAPLSGTYDANAPSGGTTNILFNSLALATMALGDHIRLSFLHGTVCAGCSLEIYYYTAGAPVLLDTITGLTAAGTYLNNFVAAAAITGFGFKYIVSSCECALQIDDIHVNKYDFSYFKIYDCCDDSLIDTLDSTDFIVTDDNISFIGLWFDYVSTKACYKIVIDDINMILNGDFPFDLSDWTQLPDPATGEFFTYDATGKAIVTLSGGESSQILTQSVELPGGCDYTVSVLTNFGAVSTLYLYVNGVEYASDVSVLAPDTVTFTISVYYPITSIGFLIESTGAGGDQDFTLDNITIVHDIFSDCICLSDNHQFCTTYVESYNDTDTTQFVFDSDFKFYVRLYSRIVNPRYPTEEEIYLSSAGQNDLNYARSEKHWDYQIERIPEYLWDALSTIFMNDNIKIGGIRYRKVIGDIEPTWTKSNTKLASGTVVIKKYTENRVK